VMPLPRDSKLCYLDHTVFLFDPHRGFYRVDADSGKKYPVTISGPGLNKTGVTNGSLFWDNGMPEPLLLHDRNVWKLAYAGGSLEARQICAALPVDGLIAYLKYDSSSGLLFAGTQSKGIIVIRKEVVKPVRTTVRKAEEQTAYYSQVALSGGRILTNEGPVLDGHGNTTAFPAIHTPFNSFVLPDIDSTLWYSGEDTIFAYHYNDRHTDSIPAGHGSITDGFLRVGNELFVANAIGIGTLRGSTVDYQYRPFCPPAAAHRGDRYRHLQRALSFPSDRSPAGYPASHPGNMRQGALAIPGLSVHWDLWPRHLAL
jgi:hypothetical protein